MDDRNYPLSILTVVVVIVSGILFSGTFGALPARGRDADTRQSAGAPLWREAVPFFVELHEPSFSDKRIARSEKFYKLAYLLHKLAGINRPDNPEGATTPRVKNKQIEKLKENIAATGPALLRMLPVLTRSGYNSGRISALERELADLNRKNSDVHNRTPELAWEIRALSTQKSKYTRARANLSRWVAVSFGIAGRRCGDWFMGELGRTPAAGINDLGLSSRKLAHRLASLSEKPLPADVYTISRHAREVVRALVNAPKSEARAVFRAVYADNVKHRPWLKVIGHWYTGAWLLDRARNWFERMKPDNRSKQFIRQLLIYSMCEIPGGRELLLSMLPAQQNLTDRKNFMQALARCKYMPALPALKRMAAEHTSHIQGYNNPEHIKTLSQTDSIIALRFYELPELASFCRTLFDNKKIRKDARTNALETFAHVMKEKALDNLVDVFLLGDDEDEKLAAVGALGKINTRSALAFLDEVYIFDPSVRIRSKAAAGANAIRRELGQEPE